jgi:predicted chitinase
VSVQAALRAAGVSPTIAAREAPLASAAMVEFGITTQARAEMFLPQVLHESCGLRYFEEIASGAAYEGRADLGNTHVGDGRRYKGRGPIQLTGRANYRWAGNILHLALETHPEIAAQHRVGWRIAALYWKAHGLNQLADRGDFTEITQRINGGQNGAAQRRAYLARVRGLDCRPVDRWAGYTAAERRWITEWDHRPPAARQRTLHVVMVRQRKAIWHAAQGAGGWDAAHRRQRYRSLTART